ncbi:prepilin peptidase CpaA [Acetitomaculum ruminis DSM 5522]|uniref:Prepilin peptidase CpaA n=1 Tax=Acetitomaculum ruminis DSM 5522 TaxID=1120918 RepID=A0A1I0YBB0_9FIRM|nr:prepilin peptidase [Acetitomaculum ruminis]SFB09473.1 prepilin peptidase CpaA [Acetitomaculum ruminis DSM 5522]
MYLIYHGLLILLLLLAVFYDFQTLKISNKIIITGLIIGLTGQLYFRGLLAGTLNFFEGIMIPLIILIPLFVFSMIGAGDIKLLAVVGAFLGYKAVFDCIIISFLLGAVLALVKMLKEGNLLSRLQYLAEYFKEFLITKKIKPYYIPEEGNKNILHFSLEIFLGVLISLVF